MNESLRVFPAHAGMSPRRFTNERVTARFPRTRGDEPQVAGFHPGAP